MWRPIPILHFKQIEYINTEFRIDTSMKILFYKKNLFRMSSLFLFFIFY